MLLVAALGAAASGAIAPFDATLAPIFHTPVGKTPGYAGDPNGMLYRADHGIFHLFWQCDPDSQLAGTKWCHAVSRNFVEWTNKPIALPTGSFSGAATLMDDEKQTPVMTFACFGDDRKDWSEATSGGMCQARPANLHDRYLVNWTLGDHDTDGLGMKHTDAGTGWRGPDGLWRLIVGNQMAPNVGAFKTWQSPDFGEATNFTVSADDPFHHFDWHRCVTHPSLCGGSGWEPRDPEFYELPESGGVYLLKGSQKQCFGVGRDYITLGSLKESTQKFAPLFPGHRTPNSSRPQGKRDIGSDVYDAGEFWASQTVHDTRANRRIISAWVPESDCDGDTWPLKCNTTISRGWAGVHSLPREVRLESFPPEAGLPTAALLTPPLPELDLLHHPKEEPAAERQRGFVLGPGSVRELDEKGTSVEVRVEFELPTNLSDTADFDVGVQLLWSEDGSELTRVGLRPAHRMPRTDLIDQLNGDLQSFAGEEFVGGKVGHSTAEVADAACAKACAGAAGCVAWTFTPSLDGGDSSCRLQSNLPLHAMTHEGCWTPFAGYHSVSGILPRPGAGTNRTRFLQAYLDRSRSWLDGSGGYEGYGHHSYASTVRLKPGETSVELRVFADRSIVEGFVAGGRAAITGRVYPTHARKANRIGVYSVAKRDAVEVRVRRVQVWGMRNATKPASEWDGS